MASMADAEETSFVSSPSDSGQGGALDLFQACENGNTEQVKWFLAQKETDLGRTKDGLTCLEVAVENGKRDVVKLIIDHKGWKDSLRNPTMDPQDYTLQNTPFRKLVKKMPDIAKLVLKKCTKTEDGMVHFDCEFVEEFSIEYSDQTDTGATVETTGCGWRRPKKECFFAKENHVLEEMVDNNDLLTDPVVTSLLRFKWTRYVAVLYFINLLIYLVFLSFLTAFALRVPNPQLDMCSGDGRNGSNGSTASTGPTCDLSSRRERVVISTAVITIIFSIIRLLIEVCQLLKAPFHIKNLLKRRRDAKRRNQSLINESLEASAKPQIYQQTNETKKTARARMFLLKVLKLIDWKYFKRESNYLEVTMYVLSLVFVGVLHRDCLCPSRGQWQAGIIAVFFAWIDLILFLNKSPTFGIYIEMFRKIIWKFLAVSIIAVLLVIAFGLAFYMAFYEPDLPDTPFENPGVTFVHMVSYAIGSPDISIFRLSNDDTEVDTIPYPGISYVIWIVAGVVVSVLFLNLLVGLAVDDVKELKEQADVERVKRMIELFKQVEDIATIMTAVFKRMGCTRIANVLDCRMATDYSIKLESVWTKHAVLWGAETDNITSRIKHEESSEDK